MKRAHHFAFLTLAVVTMLVASLLVLAPSKAVLPVAVAYYGTTNDAVGNVLYCFLVTNSMAEAMHGSYAVEVLHNGVWFNALPQPKGVDNLANLPAWTGTCFSVPAPIGRAERGLKVQPSPPGEKWRTYFSYATSAYPHNIIGRLMERLRDSIGLKKESKGCYAFSPEMLFTSANPQIGANRSQPIRSETNRTSSPAGSRSSP
jgi:hypothetical protein